MPRATPEERLQKGLERKPNGCLEWTGDADKAGYGRISVNSKTVRTHRLVWELYKGPIPPGINVLHHCDNPPCCETEPTDGFPDGHLFLGTYADNNADRDAKGRNWNQSKTVCPQGHEYTEENTYFYPNGHRACRMCHVDSERAFRRKDGPVSPLNRDKTHCKNGHLFDEANTRISTPKDRAPRRHCRACDRDVHRGRYKRDEN